MVALVPSSERSAKSLSSGNHKDSLDLKEAQRRASPSGVTEGQARHDATSGSSEKSYNNWYDDGYFEVASEAGHEELELELVGAWNRNHKTARVLWANTVSWPRDYCLYLEMVCSIVSYTVYWSFIRVHCCRIYNRKIIFTVLNYC